MANGRARCRDERPCLAGEDGSTVGVDWRMRLRRVWAVACLVLVVVACGGGSLSLSEYNTQGMAVATAMEERIAALDAELDSQASTVERARTYWERRLEARREALEGFQALDPPDEIAELAETGLDLFGELIAAEDALAVRVASFDTVTEPEQWWNTAEGEAVRAVEEDIDALCQVFQAMYDATIERTGFSDVPWIPTEMKEVIQVDIGCQQ